MQERELLDILRLFMERSGAKVACTASEERPRGADECVARLGNGMLLFAQFAEPEGAGAVPSRAELMERGARALRAALARQGRSEVPVLVLPSDTPDPKHVILARIQQFLQGLVDTTGMRQATLSCWGRVVASAHPADEVDLDRLPLLLRQLQAAARAAVDTSHGELVREDLYAFSFWYDAYLVVFARGPYSVDFARHRCRQIGRELVHLLNLLDDGPDAPARIAPPPGDED